MRNDEDIFNVGCGVVCGVVGGVSIVAAFLNSWIITVSAFISFLLIFTAITYIIVNKYKGKYEHEKNELVREYNRKEWELNSRIKRFEDATSGESILFKKIPSAIADLKTLAYEKVADFLKYKTHPAISSAELIRKEYRNKAKEAVKEAKIATYKLEALLSIFPELNQYIEDENSLEEISRYTDLNTFNSNRDVAKDYLSNEEWQKLSTTERNQLALDRYVEGRKKSNWAIGRDYEMCCSYMYEGKGYNIERCGIEKRLEDLGRDIIATNKRDNLVIQCKYWGKEKIIRENIIMQLYGTTIAYEVEKGQKANSVLMIPSFSVLSETAQKFIEVLGVAVVRQDLVDFPRIKCNINGDNKIYHLPFDQQYDTTKIDKSGEFYAWTVKEAEDRGFRRAMRHFVTNG